MIQIQKSNSLITINLLRTLAALGVFFYHLHIGNLLANYTGVKLINKIDAFGAVYAVPLFFLISGYCIHFSNIKYVKSSQKLPLVNYFKRRLLRVYPPYLIALLFSVAVNYVTQPHYHITGIDFLVHLFLLQGVTVNYFNTINVVMWTISIEVALYFIYPVFYYMRLNFSLDIALLFTLIVSFLSIYYFSTKGTVSLPEHYFVLNLWFAWCCGAYLADKKALNEKELRKPLYKIIYAIIFIAFFMLKMPVMVKYSIINYQFNILIWTAPFLLFTGLEKWFSNKDFFIVKILAAIGLSSYSLYLLHDPLIAFKNFCTHHFLRVQLQTLAMLLGILIIPVIAWVSYLYIEKPFMATGRKAFVNV